MHPIVEKFEMFDEIKARPMLLDFQHNYARIVSGLEQSLSVIQDEKSKRGVILAKLAAANEALREAAAIGAHFMRNDAAAAAANDGEVRCPACGATGQAAAFPDYNQGYGPGFKKCANMQRCNQIFNPAQNRNEKPVNMEKD
jgi:hypothetical protein